MNCTINSASNFSGLQAGMSPISLVQLAGSVRKFNLNRPFILPILECNVNFQKNWNDYFKFTFVRNPWDRLVSTWKQKCCFFAKNPQNIPPAFRSGGMYKSMYTPYKDSFKDFIIALWETPDKFYFPYEGMIDRHVRMFIDLCPIKETIYIGRVENLQQDFDIICSKIGISKCEIPHLNKTNHKHYTEYYDDETKEIVAEKYAKDIEYFNYEFGE